MANQKKKRRKKKLGKWKRKRGRKENASKKKFCRALVEDSVDSDNGWTFSSAGNSSLRTPLPHFLLLASPPPSSVTCPVTNPIIMPIQLSKLCAYFNFSSLFTVALFYFFSLCFFSRVLWPGKRWNGAAKQGGGGASALIGAATFSGGV